MRKSFDCKTVISLVGAFLLFQSVAPARVDAAEGATRAQSILREMSALMKSTQAFTFKVETTWDLPSSEGIFLQVTHQADVALRRPNKLNLEMTGDLFPRKVWYDGSKLTMLNPVKAVYATQEVPDTIDATLDFFMKSYSRGLPLADFLYSDPYAAMTQNMRAAHYVGRHMVDGVPTHHLVFLHDEIDWQIWIEDGDKPLPRKMAIAYRTHPGVPRFTAVFSDWNLKPLLSEARFKFAAPEGVKRVMFVSPFE